MGYAVAFFIFFVLCWNFFVLLFKLIEYIFRCRKARIGAATGTGGLYVGAMDHDVDYEATGTRYVKNDRGDYELIERNDLSRVPRDSEQSNMQFFDSQLDKRMKTPVHVDNVIIERPGDELLTKEVIAHTTDNKL